MRSLTEALPCPVCGGAPGPAEVCIERAPLLCNRLYESAEEARTCAVGSIALAACTACGHVYNRAFEPERVVYGPDYDNDLHASATFGKYASMLARELVHRFNLFRRPVLELGCGRGRFLGLLHAAGAGRGLGVDPGVRPGTSPEGVELFATLPPATRAAFGVCRHVLEHLARPETLLTTLHSHLEEDARAYVEVPDFATCLARRLVWDVIYEHVSYFTADGLRRVCAAAGFETTRVRPGFDFQFLGLELRRIAPGAAVPEEPPGAAPVLAGFGQAFREEKERWTRFLAAHPRTVPWGAGSKGVMLRAAVPGGLPLIVDISPDKQGRYLPLSGARVIPPTALRDLDVEAVLVLNPQYAREIGARLRELGLLERIRVEVIRSPAG